MKYEYFSTDRERALSRIKDLEELGWINHGSFYYYDNNPLGKLSLYNKSEKYKIISYDLSYNINYLLVHHGR